MTVVKELRSVLFVLTLVRAKNGRVFRTGSVLCFFMLCTTTGIRGIKDSFSMEQNTWNPDKFKRRFEPVLDQH